MLAILFFVVVPVAKYCHRKLMPSSFATFSVYLFRGWLTDQIARAGRQRLMIDLEQVRQTNLRGLLQA